MINEMLKSGIINKWRFLLDNYKKVGLSENELILILLVMHFSSVEKKFVTPNEIANYSNFTTNQVDEMFNELQKKQFIEIKTKRDKLEMDLSPLFHKIEIIIENNSTNYNQTLLTQKINDVLVRKMSNLEYKQFSSLVNNKLSDYQLTVILHNITTPIKFNELLELVKSKIDNKPTSLTKFNWLND